MHYHTRVHEVDTVSHSQCLSYCHVRVSDDEQNFSDVGLKSNKRFAAEFRVGGHSFSAYAPKGEGSLVKRCTYANVLLL